MKKGLLCFLLLTASAVAQMTFSGGSLKSGSLGVSAAGSFAADCATAGTIKCDGAEGSYPYSSGSGTVFWPINGLPHGAPYVYGTDVFIDLTASPVYNGAHSFRITIPPSTGADGDVGTFRMDFWDDNSDCVGPGCPGGDEFYLDWYQYSSSTRLQAPGEIAYGGDGEKDIIVAGQLGAACDLSQIVISNLYNWGVPSLYWGCTGGYMGGYYGFQPILADGRTMIQTGPGLNCIYSNVNAGNLTGCVPNVKGQWVHRTMHVKTGLDIGTDCTSGGANGKYCNKSRQAQIDIYQDGQLIHTAIGEDIMLNDGAGNNLRYGRIWFSPYNTGRCPKVWTVNASRTLNTATLTIVPGSYPSSFSTLKVTHCLASTPITVSGLGAPFDGTSLTVGSTPSNLTVTYNVANSGLTSASGGTVSGDNLGAASAELESDIFQARRNFPAWHLATPEPPDFLRVTQNGSGQPVLSWRDNSANETGFEVYRCVGKVYACNANGTWTLVTTTSANATGYTDVGATPATGYVYRVRAVNGSGNSTYTNPWPNKPRPPYNLTASSVTSTGLTLNWTRQTTDTETQFLIEQCTGASCTAFTQVAAATAGSVSKAITGLTTGTTYGFRVTADGWAGPWDVEEPWAGNQATRYSRIIYVTTP